LAQVRKELESIRIFLVRDDKDPESYEGILHRVRDVFSVKRLGEGWLPVKNQISAELRSGLVLLSQFMPDEEPPLDDDALVQLNKEFSTWESNVEASELPQHVKVFLLDQIAHVRRAVREYQFRGKVAFEDSAIDAATEWMRAKRNLQDYSNDPVVEGVRGLWPRTEKISRRTMLVGGAVTAVLAPLHQALGIAEDLGLLPKSEPEPPPASPQQQDQLDEPRPLRAI
jgi:hypothetical protein